MLQKGARMQITAQLSCAVVPEQTAIANVAPHHLHRPIPVGFMIECSDARAIAALPTS
jgi:hypothetical protein